MNVEELLDQLDEVIDKGLGLGSRRCIVDAEKIRILIDDIRLNMPQEIKQARSIVSDRADIITTAKARGRGHNTSGGGKGQDACRAGRNNASGAGKGGRHHSAVAAEKPRNAQSRTGVCG